MEEFNSIGHRDFSSTNLSETDIKTEHTAWMCSITISINGQKIYEPFVTVLVILKNATRLMRYAFISAKLPESKRIMQEGR